MEKVSNNQVSQLEMKTPQGVFRANAFSENECVGMSTEFITEDGKGPRVKMEFDKNGNLHLLVYDKTSEVPFCEIEFEDGKRKTILTTGKLSNVCRLVQNKKVVPNKILLQF